MIKSVTRTLYIDGKTIAEYTQDPMADSELADIEQIAAHLSPAVKRHVVCLYVEHHMETASQVSSDLAQP